MCLHRWCGSFLVFLFFVLFFKYFFVCGSLCLCGLSTPRFLLCCTSFRHKSAASSLRGNAQTTLSSTYTYNPGMTRGTSEATRDEEAKREECSKKESCALSCTGSGSGHTALRETWGQTRPFHSHAPHTCPCTLSARPSRHSTGASSLVHANTLFCSFSLLNSEKSSVYTIIFYIYVVVCSPRLIPELKLIVDRSSSFTIGRQPVGELGTNPPTGTLQQLVPTNSAFHLSVHLLCTYR